jgi:hypothetical protein
MRDCPKCETTYVPGEYLSLITYIGAGMMYCGACGTLYNINWTIATPKYYEYFLELQKTLKEAPQSEVLTKSCVKSINQFTAKANSDIL